MSTELGLTNDSLSPADDLAGNFTIVAPGFLLNNFDPFAGLQAGDTIENLLVELDSTNYGSFSGSITLSSTSENPSSSSSLSDVVISIVGLVTYKADFNQDLIVDSNDLADWRTGFGKATGSIHGDGDADADGDVDGRDFLIWQRQYGSIVSLLATQSTVPEPGAWALAIFAGLCGIGAQRSFYGR